MSEIESLNDEKNYVCIAHKNRPEVRFRFSVDNIKKSGFLSTLTDMDKTIINSDKAVIITEGNINEFNFIMKYLDFCENIPEIEPPEHPLPRDKTINEIFELEYIIFEEVLDENYIERNIKLLADVVNLANHLEMEKLYIKACALIAFNLQLIKTHEERQRVTALLCSKP